MSLNSINYLPNKYPLVKCPHHICFFPTHKRVRKNTQKPSINQLMSGYVILIHIYHTWSLPRTKTGPLNPFTLEPIFDLSRPWTTICGVHRTVSTQAPPQIHPLYALIEQCRTPSHITYNHHHQYRIKPQFRKCVLGVFVFDHHHPFSPHMMCSSFI